MSETTDTFRSMVDLVMKRYQITMLNTDVEDPALSRVELISIYNAAASLTVAQEIENAVMKITGQ